MKLLLLFMEIMKFVTDQKWLNIYFGKDVFTNISVWPGCDKRSIFKPNLRGLNLEISFA